MEEQSKAKVELDYLRMLREIAALVETDFCFDMDSRFAVPEGEMIIFTSAEGAEMANLLGRIYLIAHCIHCTACQSRFSLPREIKNKKKLALTSKGKR
mgnify:CR=1 FL=1